MELLFWLSLGVIVYVYAGYPALLGTWAWAKRGQTPFRAAASAETGSDPIWPGVTVVIAARNEARRLPARIENLIESDYPKDRLQIVVASDGSTDDTVDALAPYAQHIELIALPPGGKACALNAAVARATHPIVVFADARQRFCRDAMTVLVSHFEDQSIGAVSGELVLDCEEPGLDIASASTIADGVGAYWKYEKWLRSREAVVGSTLGVTGAIYAMRRSLWQPLPPNTILDDVLGPMRVVLAGYRVIFDGRARAFDETARDASSELRRKVRTLAGNFQLIAREPRLIVPFVNPVWLQFVSHKLGRLLVPYALITLFAASAALATEHLFYTAAFAVQAACYALAVYGAVLDRRGRAAVAVPAGSSATTATPKHTEALTDEAA